MSSRTILCALLLAAAAPLDAQSPAAEWNSARALELIERARERRLLPQQDSALQNYTARAEGFVYFYLDRRESDERTLVKVDQVALELAWAPPDRASQTIVGLRDESRLPNRMYYHLDHLTVVQNGFGDMIVMGDGDEVRDVPHPAAPGSDTIYDFRLADSTTLNMPSVGGTVRVYELEVRPQRTDRPALVGSVFVDRASADIVRMTFTFTPVSYVDRRLDYISVSLDNGLWEGRYWLPHEQTLQIRRQLPELDFAAGAVIQGRMRIADYTFNDSLPPDAFLGRRGVRAVPAREREGYEFERGLYDDLEAEGLGAPADLASVRRQAAELLGTGRISGLPRLRLGLGSVSSAFRYNRAEGVVVGGGLAWTPTPTWRADIAGGFAFGPERPWGSASLTRDGAPTGLVRGRVLFREPRDIGVAPALPAVINTISAATLGRDYTDPWFATGVNLLVTRRLGPSLRVELEAGAERHRSASLSHSTAPLNDERSFRPIRAIDEGDGGWARVTLRRPMPDPRAEDWSGAFTLEAGTHESSWYIRPAAQLGLRRANAAHSRDLEIAAGAGFVSADGPSQKYFAIGGLGTLPGYAFRSYAGRRYALVSAQASADLVAPWIRLRGVAAAGATGLLSSDSPRAWQTWPVAPSDGLRASAGAGVALFWNLLRVDAVRGLNGGSWRWVISFQSDLSDIS